MPNSFACACAKRPDFAPIQDDEVMRWLAVDIGEWEELRQCPECGATWLAVWPEESESPPVLCRPKPDGTRRLRDLDHAATMRPYCLARLEELLGEIETSRLRHLLAAHLSEKNNVPALAREALLRAAPAVEERLTVASQDGITPWLEL